MQRAKMCWSMHIASHAQELVIAHHTLLCWGVHTKPRRGKLSPLHVLLAWSMHSEFDLDDFVMHGTYGWTAAHTESVAQDCGDCAPSLAGLELA